jgi:hypothetical protein
MPSIEQASSHFKNTVKSILGNKPKRKHLNNQKPGPLIPHPAIPKAHQ